MLVTCGWDKKIRLWDVEEAVMVGVFEGHETQVCTVSIDPTGKIIASGGGDNTVSLWNIEDRN